jgi:hypothetical protein
MYLINCQTHERNAEKAININFRIYLKRKTFAKNLK